MLSGKRRFTSSSVNCLEKKFSFSWYSRPQILPIRRQVTDVLFCKPGWFILGFTGSKLRQRYKEANWRLLKIKLHFCNFLKKRFSYYPCALKCKSVHLLGYEIKAQRVNDYIDNKGRPSVYVSYLILLCTCISHPKQMPPIHENGKIYFIV